MVICRGDRPSLETLAAQLGVKVTVGRKKKSIAVLKDDCDITLGLREFLGPAKTQKTGQGKLSPLEQRRIQLAMEGGRASHHLDILARSRALGSQLFTSMPGTLCA